MKKQLFKKRIFALASAAAMTFALTSCGEETTAVKINVPENQEYLTLGIGDEISVVAQTKKSENISWSCDDDSVAVISPSGQLTGLANGVTVVTARTESGYDNVGVVVGNGVKGTAAPTVSNNGAAGSGASTQRVYDQNSRITGVSISLNGMTEDETLLLSNNDTGTFRVTVTPSDCDDPIYFDSSDTTVVEVDDDGNVTPVSKGTATITASAPNGVNDTFKIFVK